VATQTRLSAGILLYRYGRDGAEVLLIQPGGPYWRRKTSGSWQVPKGGVEAGEELLEAALREFEEELGTRLTGTCVPLGRIRQAGGKQVEGFACQGDLDPAKVVSAVFEMEWPPRSGRIATYPEVDEARWFTIPDALECMLPSQRPLVERLAEMLDGAGH